MARVTLANVTSTILEKSYYETLATTELNTATINGEKVVTDPNDVCIVRIGQIKIDELQDLLDARLVNLKDAAIRLHAMSLAINPDTTDKQIYDALIAYDCHPELVSVVIQIGKSYVVETIDLLKKRGSFYYDGFTERDELLREAAGEGSLEKMRLLKALGATNYDRALARAAGNGQLEAMTLLENWGAKDYAFALANAAEGGQLEAMTLIETWGVSNHSWALNWAAAIGQIEAMKKLFEIRDVSLNYDEALTNAAGRGRIEAMTLLQGWGATDFNQALLTAAANGHVEAMKLLKKWGADNYSEALEWALFERRVECRVAVTNLLTEWINERDNE